MPGLSTCVVLLRISLLADCWVRPIGFSGLVTVLIASSVLSGSATAVAPVVGAGVMDSGPRLSVPTMFIDFPLAKVRFAELPFAARAPPFAAVHAASIMTEPSKVMVGPPEMSIEGQPLRPFG